ncbi:MAG TPA: acyl-CoA reductase [Stellaceae bacterium]|nr:acyl-CoA reductase [Stellaceae bacterium]
MQSFTAPAIIRGKLITENLVRFGGRDGASSFESPDPASLIDRLPLKDPGALLDLYGLSFDEIVDYLVELGSWLDLAKNEFLQESLDHSYDMSDQTPPLLHRQYAQMGGLFTAPLLREAIEASIGIKYLEGWNPRDMADGRTARVRAFGCRALHIVAGNSPFVSAITIIRNALTRSDAIIKAPSNDPLTSLAIARTMAKIAPDHPLTRHLSVAYWKGGDEAFEQPLYQPSNIEKIIAWGGFASVKHVTRYVQPGLELVTLDPKRSATVIGREAFESDDTLRDVALRAATDIGALNQLGCVAARVIFVESGTDDAGIVRLARLGELIYSALQNLPESISTRAKSFDPELRANIQALKTNRDFYTVIGGKTDEGAVIVSHTDEPVDFYPSLACRVANLVPIDDYSETVKWMNAYTQTIGVYPEALRLKLRDLLPLYGAQRLITLGYANTGSYALPQDAIEPTRRMVKWIVDESCEPERLRPLWAEPVGLPAMPQRRRG